MDHEEDEEIKKFWKGYTEELKGFEERLRKCKNLRRELRSKYRDESSDDSEELNFKYDHEKARARNDQLLKEFLKSKAILRTQTVYSPTDQVLYERIAAYRQSLEEART